MYPQGPPHVAKYPTNRQVTYYPYYVRPDQMMPWYPFNPNYAHYPSKNAKVNQCCKKQQCEIQKLKCHIELITNENVALRKENQELRRFKRLKQQEQLPRVKIEDIYQAPLVQYVKQKKLNKQVQELYHQEEVRVKIENSSNVAAVWMHKPPQSSHKASQLPIKQFEKMRINEESSMKNEEVEIVQVRNPNFPNKTKKIKPKKRPTVVLQAMKGRVEVLCDRCQHPFKLNKDDVDVFEIL